jgi:hypothetical protein
MLPFYQLEDNATHVYIHARHAALIYLFAKPAKVDSIYLEDNVSEAALQELTQLMEHAHAPAESFIMETVLPAARVDSQLAEALVSLALRLVHLVLDQLPSVLVA